VIAKLGPQFIGIAGPSGAGKTMLAEALKHRLGHDTVDIIPLDAYYRDRSGCDATARAQLNFDEPNAFDWPLLMEHLDMLRAGQAINRPIYDYSTHSRSQPTVDVEPVRYMVIEGVLTLHHPGIRDFMTLRVYVDCDPDMCLQRRIDRDVRERGRTRESVVRQYQETVRPMFEKHVLPTREHADIIVRGDEGVARSVDVIVQALAGAP
jgi:uridine kinase